MENPTSPKSRNRLRNGLTRKQKVFADALLAEPTKSLTAAAREAYPTVTEGTARMIGSENLTKPNILAYLAQHTNAAEQTVVEVMNESKLRMYSDTKESAQFAKVGLEAANAVLDRIHGKATQRLETSNTNVVISIDLTA